MIEETKAHFLYLLQLALADYVKYVISKELTYHRYVQFFLALHEHNATPNVSDNVHRAAFASLTELLTKRQTLAVHVFGQGLQEIVLLELLQEAHDTTLPGQHFAEKNAKAAAVLKKEKEKGKSELSNIGKNLIQSQFNAIAEWMMQGVDMGVCLLLDRVSGSDIEQFFMGKKSLHVALNQNYKFVMMMSAMEEFGLIDSDWRTFVEIHNSIVSAQNDEPMSRQQLYHAQSTGRKLHGDLYREYIAMANKIKALGV